MCNLRVIVLLFLFLPIVLRSQQSNRTKQRSDISGKQWNVSAIMNYDLEPPELSWSTSLSSKIRDIDLTFLTPNSGTFEAENDSIKISQTIQYQLPISQLGLGFGLEIINPQQLYHRFQIPRLQLTKFENTTLRSRIKFDNPLGTYDTKDFESVRAFMFSFRYEVGKYIRSIISDRLRFGFGFNLSTKYYSIMSIDDFK